MRRRFSLLAAAGVVAAVLPLQTVAFSSPGVSPAQLSDAGWTCINGPRPFNPRVHCAPPGQLDRVISGEAETATFLTFDTEDPTSTNAPFLGTERMIRADIFHGQPCPTDPPSREYSYLGPLLGWDYYICHTFDSPW
jgi:hypothetical protein